jgi:hypothetical protein
MKKLSLAVAVVVCFAAAFTVESATKATGTLKVVSPGVALELKIGDKPAPVPNGKELPMPAGTYTPFRITCGAQQAAGNGPPVLWTIKSVASFGKLSQIIVAEGQVTNVEAGPPFTLKVGVSKPTTTGGQPAVLIGIAILGKSNESYAANTLMKGLSLAPPPQFKIVDDKGTTLAQGNFEYG